MFYFDDLVKWRLKRRLSLPTKLVVFSLFIRLVSILWLLASSSLIPCFDCSAHLQYKQLQSLIRWDTLHFFSIHSIQRAEQHFAFAPAIFQLINFLRSNLPHHPLLLLISTSLLATLFSTASSLILFYLTLEIFQSLEFARLVTILHILSPSPSTQVVPYTEPFYAFFSFSTFYAHVLLRKYSHPSSHPHGGRKILMVKFLLVSSAAIATSFRSLGILHSTFWCFDFLHSSINLLSKESSLSKDRKTRVSNLLLPIAIKGLETLIMTLINIGPFLYDQWIGYQKFCKPQPKGNIFSNNTGRRPWCSNSIPSIYNFVQSHYWGNGFLKYWTWNQFPLFILSFPMYLVTIIGLINYYQYYFRFLLVKINSFKQINTSKSNKYILKEEVVNHSNQRVENNQEEDEKVKKRNHYRPFLTCKIDIYVHVQLLLTLILLLNSHVQIILRQASTMPFIWWTLADQILIHWNEYYSTTISNKKNLNSINYLSQRQVEIPNSNDYLVTTKKSIYGLFSHMNVQFNTGRWYFSWIVIWWPISLLLWAGFYPPA